MDVASEKNNIAPGLVQTWPVPPTVWPRATTTNPHRRHHSFADGNNLRNPLGGYCEPFKSSDSRLDCQFAMGRFSNAENTGRALATPHRKGDFSWLYYEVDWYSALNLAVY
jgi:hypothetical protein